MFKVFNKYPWLIFIMGGIYGFVSNILVTKYFEVYGLPETIFARTCIIFLSIFGLAVVIGIVNGIIQVYSNKNK